jgi:hypothetical protein
MSRTQYWLPGAILAGALLCVSFLNASAQSTRVQRVADVLVAVTPDSSMPAISRTAGEGVRFTLTAKTRAGLIITDWDASGDTAIVWLRNSIAENDTLVRSWNADTLSYSWTELRLTSTSGAAPLRTGPYTWRIPATEFSSGALAVTLISTLAEKGVYLEAAALHGAGKTSSVAVNFYAGPVTNYLVELTPQAGWDGAYRMRRFEIVITARDRYMNKNSAQKPVQLSARFQDEFTASTASQFGAPKPVAGSASFHFTPTITRLKGSHDLQSITVTAANDNTIRGVSDGIQVLDHAPAPFTLSTPLFGTVEDIRNPNQVLRFSWTRDAISDPWTDVRIGRNDSWLYSDTLWYTVVFADSNCVAVDSLPSAGAGMWSWVDLSGAELLALMQRVYGPQPPKDAFLTWYVVATDGIYTTRNSLPPGLPWNACGQRVEVRDATIFAGKYPPAPFVLTPDQSRPNATLFRMDHVGIVDGFPDNLSRDTLHLRWQPSLWQPPDSDRNDPSDSIRYEVNIIIDSLGATSKTLTVSFPSSRSGRDTEIAIPGLEVYRRLFRPDPWPQPEPDTIVMRVNWYVRAYNSIGFTYSDTAGVTARKDFTPTPPLVLSYNRPPEQPPVAIQPVHNAVIGNLTAQSPLLDIIWTHSRDRNIDKGIRIDCFKRFNAPRMEWMSDLSGRTVDTLACQWVGVVVRTVPAWRGAPVGSCLVRNTGFVTGFQMDQRDFAFLFGSMDSMSSAAADSVILDWRVFVKDFNSTESPALQKVNFRYDTSGTLRPDTALWSRFGERPHELCSPWFRLTLARRRGGSTGVESPVSPSLVTLSQNYPNPFVSGWQGTSFAYTLHGRAAVRLVITNALGVIVRSMDEGQRSAGSYSLRWDGRDAAGGILPAGVYVYSVYADRQRQSRVLCVVR